MTSDKKVMPDEFEMPMDLYNKVVNQSVPHLDRDSPAWQYSLQDAEFGYKFALDEAHTKIERLEKSIEYGVDGWRERYDKLYEDAHKENLAQKQIIEMMKGALYKIISDTHSEILRRPIWNIANKVLKDVENG